MPLGAGALAALSRLDADQFLEEVEWPTLAFFMGLCIMVGALVEVGVIGRIGQAVTGAVGDRYLLASSALLWGSAALSGIVDNIPYVATMTPLVPSLVDAGNGAQGAKALWWPLALGADRRQRHRGRRQRQRGGHRHRRPQTGTRSPSGTSPGTASSSRSPPSPLPGPTAGCGD